MIVCPHPCLRANIHRRVVGKLVGRMAKLLSARAVEAIKEDGRHAVGDGLYLVIDGANRRWQFRFQMDGRRREMGLGPYPAVTLANAREMVAAARKVMAVGGDPIDVRKASVRRVPTFGDCADELIESLEKGFRNEKHAAQWAVTLGKVAYDDQRVRIEKKAHSAHVSALSSLRSKPVDQVETTDVLAVLTPIWQEAAETASRVRGRIEKVLNAAKAKGYRSGENPAAWRGHLANLLPKRQKLQRGHHAALPYADLPAFILALRQRDSVAALALEFGILTAARSGEILGARWSEINQEAALWTVPASRMKAGREHRVPLTKRCLEILEKLDAIRTTDRDDDFVFPGQKPDRPLSPTAITMVLRRMKAVGVTPHGFRSTFRDWAGEETHFPREIAEAALAHVFGDATERAYRRGDALEKRRNLMTAWASYCDGNTGNVVALRAPSASA